MMTIRQPALILSLACSLSGCGAREVVSATSRSPDGRVQLALTVRSDRTYELRLTNLSAAPLKYFDDLSRKSRYTTWGGPAQIFALDSAGGVATANTSDRSGWWTSNILISQGHDLPAEMVVIQPGESAVGVFSLDRTVEGLLKSQDTPAQWLGSKRLQLRARMYFDDENLKRSIDVGTKYFQFPMARAGG
jgi:hypothetical protein